MGQNTYEKLLLENRNGPFISPPDQSYEGKGDVARMELTSKGFQLALIEWRIVKLESRFAFVRVANSSNKSRKSPDGGSNAIAFVSACGAVGVNAATKTKWWTVFGFFGQLTRCADPFNIVAGGNH